jgi:TOTE conflict system, Archaeo-Eukaryotic Primase domain
VTEAHRSERHRCDFQGAGREVRSVDGFQPVGALAEVGTRANGSWAARIDVVDGDADAHLADALVEIEELRAEVARLRGLLGMDARGGDGHRQAWAPTLFTQQAETAALDSTASIGEKVALLRSMFGARSDVYAIRWQNDSTGKSGWSPAVFRGPMCCVLHKPCPCEVSAVVVDDVSGRTGC